MSNPSWTQVVKTVEPEQPELKRVLGPGLLLLFIVGDILGTGIYALTGQVAAEVGGAAWLPFLLAFAVATVTAFSYLEQGIRHPFPHSHRVLRRDVVGYHVGINGLTRVRGEPCRRFQHSGQHADHDVDRARVHRAHHAGQSSRRCGERLAQCAPDPGRTFGPSSRHPHRHVGDRRPRSSPSKRPRTRMCCSR
jgi:hypothetical protein